MLTVAKSLLFSALIGCATLVSNESVLQGIILAPNEESLKNCPTSPHEVVNCQVALPGNGKKLLDILRAKYLEQPLTEEEMVKVKRAIIRFYRSEGHPAVDVQIRELKNGFVAFIITDKEGVFRSGRVISRSHLEKYIDIATGENIAQDLLLTNVDYLNRNPFRRSIVLFPPDSQEGTSDLKLINDKFPVRFFLGGDNSGTRFTGRSRIYGGLTWDHVLGLDDVIHYQYSCNPNLHKFQSHYGTYIAFFPWKNILTVSGLYEKTEGGKQLQTTFRYTVPLEPINKAFKQEGTMGLNYKNLNTNRFFIDTGPIRTHFVNLIQLYINYSLERAWKKNELTCALEVFLAPGKVLANQSDSSFSALRPHAKNKYIYVRGTLGDLYKLPHNFSLAGLLRFQLATSPLLPSEQFGLGGYNTVRGYYERTLNADDALCVNAELRFPSISLIRKGKDELIFLGFIDYGLGFNLDPSSGNPSREHLLGLGPGLRYQIDTHFSLRGDWGFQLHKLSGRNPQSVAHVGVVGLF